MLDKLKTYGFLALAMALLVLTVILGAKLYAAKLDVERARSALSAEREARAQENNNWAPEEIETGDPRAAGKRRAANPAAPAAERDDLDRVEQLLRKMEQTNT